MQINTVLRRVAPHSASPEAHLFLAVIGQAVSEALSHSNGSSVRIQRRHARAFFLSGGHGLFCEFVGLNPDWVAEILRDYGGMDSWQGMARD